MLTQLIDIQIAAGHTPPPELEAAGEATAHVGAILRVYDARNRGFPLPEQLLLVRRDGDPPTTDPAVNEVFDAMAATHAFYSRELGRDSLDGNRLGPLGGRIVAEVLLRTALTVTPVTAPISVSKILFVAAEAV